MLLIKTYVAKSEIEGKGLFSEDPLPQGFPFYKVGPDDLFINQEEIPEYLRAFFDKHATVEEIDNQRFYFLDGDNCIFMNHSDNPNVAFFNNIGLTLKEIEPNEELTCDYRTITIPEHFEYLMLINDTENI